jgi:hypothetical protein
MFPAFGMSSFSPERCADAINRSKWKDKKSYFLAKERIVANSQVTDGSLPRPSPGLDPGVAADPARA